MGPNGLVLDLFGQIIAVFVIKSAGAANDTAAVTPMGCRPFTAPRILSFGLGLTTDLLASVKLTQLKIFGGVGAGLVDDVGQHIGAIGGHPFTGDRMFS